MDLHPDITTKAGTDKAAAAATFMQMVGSSAAASPILFTSFLSDKDQTFANGTQGSTESGAMLWNAARIVTDLFFCGDLMSFAGILSLMISMLTKAHNLRAKHRAQN